MSPHFTGGVNIAIKILKGKYEATLTRYRDVLHFDVAIPEQTHWTMDPAGTAFIPNQQAGPPDIFYPKNNI